MGIFANQNVGTNLERFNMFGVSVERVAGNVVERCLLGHIATVGDYTASMSGEIAKLQVRKRFYQLECRMI